MDLQEYKFEYSQKCLGFNVLLLQEVCSQGISQTIVL